MSCAPNEILTMTCDIIARNQERRPDDPTPHEPSFDTNFFVWSEAKLLELDDEDFHSPSGIVLDSAWNDERKRIANVNSIEISIANNLVGEKFYLGSGKLVDKIPVLLRNVTVSFEYEFEDYSMYEKIVAGTELKNLTLCFKKVTGAALPYYFQVRMPKVTIDEGPPELAGPEILTQSISATAERANTHEIEIRLQNMDTSAY